MVPFTPALYFIGKNDPRQAKEHCAHGEQIGSQRVRHLCCFRTVGRPPTVEGPLTLTLFVLEVIVNTLISLWLGFELEDWLGLGFAGYGYDKG